MSTRREVQLLETNQPRQDRAKRTYEAILAAAADLLVEVGVERISTNLIAERAGITVPALYRYFPNKYSVLHALGAKLMDQQNDVFHQWFENSLNDQDPLSLLDSVYDLLQLTCELTRQQPGGLEIIQALRAVGPLQELRLTSHRLVGRQLAEVLAELLGRDKEEIALAARVSVDLGYSVVEMALEDDSVDTEQVLRQGALMVQLYWHHLLGPQSP